MMLPGDDDDLLDPCDLSREEEFNGVPENQTPPRLPGGGEYPHAGSVLEPKAE